MGGNQFLLEFSKGIVVDPFDPVSQPNHFSQALNVLHYGIVPNPLLVVPGFISSQVTLKIQNEFIVEFQQQNVGALVLLLKEIKDVLLAGDIKPGGVPVQLAELRGIMVGKNVP